MAFTVFKQMTEDQAEQFQAVYKLYGENTNAQPKTVMKKMREFRKERQKIGMPQNPAFLHMMAGWPYMEFRVPGSEKSRDDCKGPVGEAVQSTIFDVFRDAKISFWYLQDTNTMDLYFFAVFDKQEFDRMAKFTTKEPGGSFNGFKDATYPMATLDPKKSEIPRLLWEADNYEELVRAYEQDLPKPVYNPIRERFWNR